MTVTLQHVRPGDLITAAQMNDFIDALTAFDARLTAVESGGTASANGVIISSLIPPSGTIRVGDILQVLGANFGFSTGSQRVFIDDTRIDSFEAGCTDQKLIFRVPLTITDVPASGRPAILTVTNASSTAQRTLTLQSAMTLAGGVDVNPQGVQPATPTASAPVTFQFELISQANLDATYNLSAPITVAANQSDWQSRVHILDANLVTEIQQVQLNAGQHKTVYVRINPIPPSTNGVQFGVALNVQSTTGNVGGSSGVHSYTVGSVAEQPDTTITINAPSLEIATGTASVTSTAVTVGAGGVINLTYPATFSIAATYDVDIAFLNGAAGWNVAFIQPPASPLQAHTTQTILSNELNNPQGVAPKDLKFSMQRTNAATAGDIELRVKRQGQTNVAALRMQLLLG